MAINYDAEHRKHLNRAANRVQRILEEAVAEAAHLGVVLPSFDPSRPFSFASYPFIKGPAERLIRDLKEVIVKEIVDCARQEWGFANEKNDAIARKALSGLALSQELQRAYYANNSSALDAFLKRKTAGMALSERV